MLVTSAIISNNCADEVDALLGMRKAQEHEATTALKTEFMQLWDGMATRRAANVCVLAATNRPFDLDEAILRRCAILSLNCRYFRN